MTAAIRSPIAMRRAAAHAHTEVFRGAVLVGVYD